MMLDPTASDFSSPGFEQVESGGSYDPTTEPPTRRNLSKLLLPPLSATVPAGSGQVTCVLMIFGLEHLHAACLRGILVDGLARWDPKSTSDQGTCHPE